MRDSTLGNGMLLAFLEARLADAVTGYG